MMLHCSPVCDVSRHVPVAVLLFVVRTVEARCGARGCMP
jgi:hypothetical protein